MQWKFFASSKIFRKDIITESLINEERNKSNIQLSLFQPTDKNVQLENCRYYYL